VVDAGIGVLAYQLEPALAIVRGEALRVLLADEVGLGKTIQAGLVLSELRAAGGFTRALVLTPAGLREQWSRELRERFGIETALMDAGALASLGRSLPPWVNPWTLPGVALASIDLLKRGELLPQIEHVTWDLVIVDEAHHATRGTDRHAAAALACSRARSVVLITATPHSGDAAAFRDLCELGALEGDASPLRVFRRSRQQIAIGTRPRRVRFVRVPSSVAEGFMRAKLDAYTSRVWREAEPPGAARLAMIVLRKRALSGPVPLARSLARRLDALTASPTEPASVQLHLDFGDTLGGELIADDGEPAEVLGAPGLADNAAESKWLAAVLEAARAAVPEDSKAAAIARAIRRAREPVIVFTEYRDTLDDLHRRLHGRVLLAVLHGGMLPAERAAALSAFTSGRVRLLLATDAAAEGLNLQDRCRWVIHYEVPWNPARVEQRNGRVDRLGQRCRVHAWHLVAAETEEERILAALARRSDAAARELAAETAVARCVFEGAPVPAFEPEIHAAREPSAAAGEAERLEALRRLRHRLDDAGRPAGATVKRRGTFAWLRAGELLAVFRAEVLDGSGHRVATLAAGFRSRDLGTARVAAERYFHARANTAAEVSADAAVRHAARAEQIDRALAAGTRPALQGSLFDRRALAVADHRDAEVARAREELKPLHVTHPQAAAHTMVSLALVAVFAGR
jgi:superfamily II DNA or RNA helicase